MIRLQTTQWILQLLRANLICYRFWWQQSLYQQLSYHSDYVVLDNVNWRVGAGSLVLPTEISVLFSTLTYQHLFEMTQAKPTKHEENSHLEINHMVIYVVSSSRFLDFSLWTAWDQLTCTAALRLTVLCGFSQLN